MRRPSPNYMEGLQRDITKGMRGILIDWLVEVVISIILSGFLLISIHDLFNYVLKLLSDDSTVAFHSILCIETDAHICQM
jgi:hypothetical protein